MRPIPLWLALAALLPAFAPVHAAEVPAPNEGPAPNSNAAAGLLQILQAHQWSLTAATDSQAQTIAPLFPADAPAFSFSFSVSPPASTLNFKGGCNNFGGSFQLNERGELVAGPMRSTMMACQPPLMQADAALAALLAQPLQLSIAWGAPPQLQLRTASNEILTLSGQVTPEALYGPATRIFLEVGAQMLPCRNPRNAQTTCLQVREISFDEQGLRSATPGPWQPFYDDIDGYTHTPGQRNVLRVKRFDRQATTEDAAPAVYVLDLIVETEVMLQ